MGWRAGICLLLAGTGCLLVPRHTKHETLVDAGHYDVRQAPSADLVISVLLREPTVHVAALRPRSCTRVYYKDIDVTEGYEAEVADVIRGIPNDPVAGFALLLFAPVMLGSAIVTGIVVAATDETTTRKHEVTKQADYACAVPATQLSVALPSGAIVELEPAADRASTFELSESEPRDGVLEIRGAGVKPRRIAYGRGRSDCVARRQELYAAAIALPADKRLATYRELPICNAETDDDVGSEWAWEQTIGVAAAAARGDCDVVEHTAPLLARLAPQHRGDIFGREPSIVRCLGTIARDTAAGECRARRSVALKRAQEIRDRKQRAEMLQRAPRCAVSSR